MLFPILKVVGEGNCRISSETQEEAIRQAQKIMQRWKKTDGQDSCEAC